MTELKMAELQRDELEREFADMMNSLSSLHFIMQEVTDPTESCIYKIQYDDLFRQKDDLGNRLTLAERLVYEIRASIRSKEKNSK